MAGPPQFGNTPICPFCFIFGKRHSLLASWNSASVGTVCTDIPREKIELFDQKISLLGWVGFDWDKLIHHLSGFFIVHSSWNTFHCQRSTESTESTNLIYASPTPVFAPDQKSAPSRLVDYITIIWCIVLHTIRSGSVKVLNKILLQYRSLILPTHTKYGSIISDFTLLIFQHSTAREFKMFFWWW